MELPSHIHPMVVHFPIALFIMALFFEVIGLIFRNDNFHKTAIYLYVSASLMMPLVVRTGIWEAEKLNLSHPLLDKHSQFAIWTMWLSLMSLPILWLVNKECKEYFKPIFILFLIATAILISITGDKGGQMVFEYAVGVVL